ncbi:putative nucleotidyltransferase [Streptoalloteichus tenebrarius]|uniref:Nucleotidyltransferase n=1 Tax=Streptoalloteichus tenebrarius (strain ATCC 17920 / DSM 40477 / JCM 4838 / CBS 697.72 / NBRC 16177 / NCIMB 11028 / NRRL B-12390 / A12253. 1 / ISP 5477) TaxID=1933 RepID=A0ABT1HRL5_STRSD|nr:hypothetical protein [Streptoalloteichus tenebrarius]MCP2258160.1 putative nucleotidyltransferase [Streptoalloteichus tenebrarius]BFF04613.1 hypothetical protein GCM10020241_62880 [Streptoalloteichus tenebrarius]
MDERYLECFSLRTLYEIFGVDPSQAVRRLVYKARAMRRGEVLAPLLLSVAAREGHALGSGSSDEIARARQRVATYDAVWRDLASRWDCQLVKGPTIARHYPPDVVRPVGDLDIVVDGEETLWQVVARVQELCPVRRLDLAVFGADEGHHFAVGLSWPSADPLLDMNHYVEVNTFGYMGDSQRVGLRLDVPQDTAMANVVALAEERFQREFGAKDALDLVALMASGALDDVEAVVAVAESWLVAPELLELLRYVASHASLAHVVDRDLLEALEKPARAERERRATGTGLDRPGADVPRHVMPRSRAGGLALRRTTYRSGQPEAVFREFDGLTLMHCPVGDFLVAQGGKLDAAAYRAAREHVRQDRSWWRTSTPDER